MLNAKRTKKSLDRLAERRPRKQRRGGLKKLGPLQPLKGGVAVSERPSE